MASRLANDEKEVYCYTFEATNTNTTGSGAYACIKNIINEDDLYPKIYNIFLDITPVIVEGHDLEYPENNIWHDGDE